MPITFIFFLFQWNLITFNCAVLFFNSVFIFPTKAHPPCRSPQYSIPILTYRARFNLYLCSGSFYLFTSDKMLQYSTVIVYVTNSDTTSHFLNLHCVLLKIKQRYRYPSYIIFIYVPVLYSTLLYYEVLCSRFSYTINPTVFMLSTENIPFR